MLSSRQSQAVSNASTVGMKPADPSRIPTLASEIDFL